jgi:hypothetical protein
VGGGPGWSDTIYEVRRARLGARMVGKSGNGGLLGLPCRGRGREWGRRRGGGDFRENDGTTEVVWRSCGEGAAAAVAGVCSSRRRSAARSHRRAASWPPRG